MPQPHKRSKDAKFATDAIVMRPKLAAHIGSVNAIWARIDFWLALIVAKAAAMAQIRLMVENKTHIDEVCKKLIWQSARLCASMYLSLSGTAARDAALTEALGQKDAERFEPIFKKVRSIRKRRNKVMHGICGIDPIAPEALIVQDLEDA